MKVTAGGSIGYKIQGKPYESIDVNTFISIEYDSNIESDDIEKNIQQTQEKINELLKLENRKKLKLAIEEYKTKLEAIRSL